MISQAECVDLPSQLLLHLDVLFSHLFQVSVFLLELSLRFLGDSFFDSKYFFQYIDILLECAGDLLVLFQLLGEKNLDVPECFQLGFVVFSDLIASLFASWG